MKKIDEILEWLADNQSKAYSLIRIFLGTALFTRGYILLGNPDAMLQLAGDDSFFIWFSYITIGHLIGGLFIALGLFTRIGALLQIPVLAGAVLVVHDKSLIMGGQSLELASMVLFLLIIIFLFGSGTFALGRKIGFPNM
ncbi:MAG: DoxX family protein [Cytophagales bacterium]|nr:DoxX family protein [Cytophagales bacterium]